MTDPIQVVPSLLSADFACLVSDIRKVEAAGCRAIHLDVMDGHFVPNLTIGPVVARAVRRSTSLHLTAHLMIEDPERFLDPFKESGMDRVVIHQEIPSDFVRVLIEIRDRGMEAGVSIRPKTPVGTIEPGLDFLDFILIMSVEPGFGGQDYIVGSERKVAEARAILDRHRLSVPIGVDGGIDQETSPLAVRAGATQLIAGSAVFKGDVARNIEALRNSARLALNGC
jgi:ribulose-phosphate 3-epimerase